MNNPLRYIDPTGAELQGAPPVFTATIGTYVQPTWIEVGDDSSKGHILGGANGKSGADADYDSALEWNLNFVYSGAKQMEVEATFYTDDVEDDAGNVTAVLVTPFSVVAPQPPSMGPSRGAYRQFPPFADPNDPIGFNFDLKSLSGRQLKALRDAAARRPKDPVSKKLLKAIDEEEQRRKEEAKKEEEKKKRKKDIDKPPGFTGPTPTKQSGGD